MQTCLRRLLKGVATCSSHRRKYALHFKETNNLIILYNSITAIISLISFIINLLGKLHRVPHSVHTFSVYVMSADMRANVPMTICMYNIPNPERMCFWRNFRRIPRSIHGIMCVSRSASFISVIIFRGVAEEHKMMYPHTRAYDRILTAAF